MEKKLKYLLGCFVLGVTLLFSNNVFAFGNPTIPESDVFIEGVALPSTSSSTHYACYRYKFHNFGYSYFGQVSSMMYTILKDGTETRYPYSGGPGQNKNCSFDGSQYLSNNSAYGLYLYNAGFVDIMGNGNCYGYFMNQSAGGYSPINVAFGQGDQFGKAFVYTNNAYGETGSIFSPHYSLGNGFFFTDEFRNIVMGTTSNMNFLRVFYDQILLANPLDTQNLVTSENSQSNWSGLIAWEHFTENTTEYQTKFNNSVKYISDYGSQFNKSTHFGGYGMGYSAVLNTLGTDFVRWNDFSFFQVGSRCLQSAMQLGTTSFDFLTTNKCMNLGVLVVKGMSYVSRNNNYGAIALSKDPNNSSRILFEEFDCMEDDLNRLFDSGYCNSVAHGYLATISNNDTSILPFSQSVQSYTIGSGNSFLDLMLGDGLYGYTTNSNGNICFNSTNKSACYKLLSRPNTTALKEFYLQGSLGGLPAITNVTDITEQMLLNCKGPYYNTPDGLPPAYCNTIGTDFTGSFYTSIGTDDNGNIVISIIQQNPDNTLNLNDTTFVVDSNGNYTATCSGDCNGSYIYYGHLNETLDSTGYYNSYFNKTGNFFQCPYPYTSKVTIGKKLMQWLGGYDVFVPINCAIASFQAGKQVSLFGTGNHIISGGPILYQTGGNRDLFYKFFDFLFILGLVFFYTKILKLFKH